MEEGVWDSKSNFEVESCWKLLLGCGALLPGAEDVQLVRGENQTARTGC